MEVSSRPGPPHRLVNHRTTKYQEIWPRFYIEDKVGVSITVIIPHCHTEHALKRSKNLEMLLRFYIEDHIGVNFILSIPHICMINPFSSSMQGKHCQSLIQAHMPTVILHLRCSNGYSKSRFSSEKRREK